MIPDFLTWQIVAYVMTFVTAALLLGSAVLGKKYKDNIIDVEIAEEADDGPIELDRPSINSSTTISAIKEKHKKERLAGKGYVKWYLVNESFPEPKFIKPEPGKGGIPQYEYEGETYLFPRANRLPSNAEGIWTYIHRKGEAEPMPLRDTNELAIPADVLSEYLTMSVSTGKPKFGFGLGDMGSMDYLRYGILGLIAIFILLEFTGGLF